MSTPNFVNSRWFKITMSLIGLFLLIRGCNHLLGNDVSTPEATIRSYMDGYLSVLSEPPYSAQFIGFDPSIKRIGFAGSEYTETTARYQVGKPGSAIGMAIVFEIYPNGQIFAVHADGKRVKVK